MLSTNAQRQRETRLEHIAQGLCTQCTRPATRGRRCEYHRQKDREASRRYQQAHPKVGPLGGKRGWYSGNPLPPEDYQRQLVARFWKYVNKDGPIMRPELGPCWVWTGSKAQGYGQIGVKRPDGRHVPRRAHAAAWVYIYGNPEPPKGWHVCHECNNKPCVREDHLWPGTALQNMRHAQATGLMPKVDHERIEREWREKKDAQARITREFVNRHLHLISNPRTREVLQMRYGYTYATCHTLEEVGACFDYTMKRNQLNKGDEMRNQNPVNENQEHRGVPSSEMKPTSELNAAPPFTPGPWEVGGTWRNSIDDKSKGEMTVIYAECIPLARTIWILNSGEYARSQATAAANARLIAAAPALYAALRSCEQEMRTVRGACTDEYEDAVNNAVKALALASTQDTNTLASSGKSSPKR